MELCAGVNEVFFKYIYICLNVLFLCLNEHELNLTTAFKYLVNLDTECNN